MEARGSLMSNSRNHGGKRAGAGRKPVDLDLVLRVGQAFRELEQQAYSTQKQALLAEQTNLQEFYDYINAIPLDERKDFIFSDDYKEHSRSVSDEVAALGQPADTNVTPSRLLRIKKPHGSSISIRREVAEAFGISEVKVKNYLQKYRAFLKDLE